MEAGGSRWFRQTGREPSCQISLSCRVQQPLRRIPSGLRGEQQIGELSPNNHRYLFRRRKANIYHPGSGSSRVCVCVCFIYMFTLRIKHVLAFLIVWVLFFILQVESLYPKNGTWEQSWWPKAFTRKSLCPETFSSLSGALLSPHGRLAMLDLL